MVNKLLIIYSWNAAAVSDHPTITTALGSTIRLMLMVLLCRCLVALTVSSTVILIIVNLKLSQYCTMKSIRNCRNSFAHR